MNAAITKAELARLLPEPRSLDDERARGVFLAALRARDAVLATGLPRLFARIWRRLADWYLTERTVAELQALTDRELADIGLTRGDIRRVAAGIAETPPPAPEGAPQRRGAAPHGRLAAA